ncbi:MAG: potassium transporter TrkG [Thermomicrobiales bacterium]
MRRPTADFHARLFVAIFAGIVLVGTGLLMLPWVTHSGQATPPTDALFTAMSALSVTGLVTLDTATHWNWFGQLVILLLIQIGGLGFMVGASLVLSVLIRGGRRLSHQMMISENIPTLTLSEAVLMARRIARFTFIVEGVGALLLTLRFLEDRDPPIALWHGIFHSVSAFCNAGFDLQGNFQSFTVYHGAFFLNIVLAALIQAGSLSYLAFADIFENRRWRKLSGNTRLILTFNAMLLVIGTAIFLGAEWNGAMSETAASTRPLQAVFQAVSVRTAGFATVDFSTASTFTEFSWVALMFIGGASGSTAGGVKLTTVAIILIAVLSEIRGRTEAEAFRRRIPPSLIMRAMTVVTLFFLIHFVMTLALSATEHVYGERPSFVAMLFEVMSAQATVGLSAGITPTLSTPGKFIIILTMFVGRLGPLTIAYALAKREHAARYRYPEMRVHIG